MVRPERLELPTPRFVVWCSIQLSYGRAGRDWAREEGEDTQSDSVEQVKIGEKEIGRFPARQRSGGTLRKQ